MQTGRNNYAGALAPESSEYGRAFRASVGGLIANPMPLVDPFFVRCYRGLIGVLLVRAARVAPLAGANGYSGDLPQDQQPVLRVPDPWTIPE